MWKIHEIKYPQLELRKKKNFRTTYLGVDDIL